jgi:hypothetical protein
MKIHMWLLQLKEKTFPSEIPAEVAWGIYTTVGRHVDWAKFLTSWMGDRPERERTEAGGGTWRTQEPGAGLTSSFLLLVFGDLVWLCS